MGVSTRERPHFFADRSAIRRRLRLDVLGTILVVLCSGCRSTGMASRGSNSRVANDDAPVASSLFARTNRLLPPIKTPTTTKRQATSETADISGESRQDDDDSSAGDRGTKREKIKSAGTKKNDLGVGQTRRVGFTSEDLDEEDSGIEAAGFREELTSKDELNQPGDGTPRRLKSDTAITSRDLSLSIPKEIPGATAPRHRLPPRASDRDIAGNAKKLQVIDMLFPTRDVPIKIGAPRDRVMTLEELEEIALMNNPIIAQALAAITISQGAALQAGLYPNPTAGYEADTVGSTGTRNYQGVTIQQPIKTAGKLGLAQGAANFDVMNAQLACERTKMDVLRSVRAGYYNVLVAEQSMIFTEALERLTRQVYEAMKERLKGGEQAVYELDQYNSLVIQAKTALVQSQNRYNSAWKQLAVSTGVPDLPQATLEGRIDMPVQNLNYDALLLRALTVHPDLYAARNSESQAQTQLKLARAQVLPDVTVLGVFQNDFTQPGFQRTTYNLDVTVPLPLFDRNQGNIRSAQGRLKMMSLQNSVKSMELTDLLADAFERFQTGRYQSESYRTQILPDLVRAYQGIYEAHLSDNLDVAFGDIIVAQQNMSNGVTAYVTFLSMQWLALTDIANLIQLRDFRELLNDPSSQLIDPNGVVPPPAASQEGVRK